MEVCTSKVKEVEKEIEFPLGKNLWLLSRKYLEALSKRLEHLEIERHYSVLLLIEANEAKCCQQFLSDSLNIDKVSMVRIIDLLMKKGYIERQVNPADRREYLLSLSDKARQIMPDIKQAISDMNKAALAGLDEQEGKSFLKMLQKMQENLDTLPSRTVDIPILKD